MTKHTPGPWKADLGRIATSDDKTVIARTLEPMNYEANAALIAAAPDLLAALHLAAKYVAKMVADDVKTAIPPSNALRVIEHAIALAEGRE